MKNIQEILSEYGVTVPEEKAADFDKVFKANYKTVKEVEKIESARDSVKAQLDAAQATLKKFEGIDPEKIGKELEDYKKQAEEAEKKYTRELTQRDQKAWLDKKLDEYGVTSDFARRQLVSDCMAEESGLPWKEGAFFGFDDFMKAAKEKDATLYQTKAEKKAPSFTGPLGDPQTGNGKKFVPPKIF